MRGMDLFSLPHYRALSSSATATFHRHERHATCSGASETGPRAFPAGRAHDATTASRRSQRTLTQRPAAQQAGAVSGSRCEGRGYRGGGRAGRGRCEGDDVAAGLGSAVVAVADVDGAGATLVFADDEDEVVELELAGEDLLLEPAVREVGVGMQARARSRPCTCSP